MNPMLLIDGYKLDHRRQYPKGTTAVYSNWTPRASRVAGQNEVVFFGLQYFLKKFKREMERGFFDRKRDVVLSEYKTRVDGYLGPNSIGTDHIADLWDLGQIPLKFCALPEGTLVPLRVPCLTVENTHPHFFWLVNYVETLMSNTLWLPCTSATTAFRIRRLLDEAAQKTGGDLAFVPWQGHDFSMRGLAGVEAAQLSGAGHLLSFTGTDTIPALDLVEMYYGGEDNGLVGGSVAATEHSVMSAGGKEDELATFERILDLYPEGIVSVVSDTWNLWDVIEKILPRLKERIRARNGKLVIRPDSGDPTDVICGNKDWAVPGSAAWHGVVRLLWDLFGGTVTKTGHRQLDPHIGVIYGDAINYDRAKEITGLLASDGFASTNVVFGIGSYNYQYVTRDTYGFAMKATWAKIDGRGVNLFKKPVTDDGVKNSATGRLAVKREWISATESRLVCTENASGTEEYNSLLAQVWFNGEFLGRQSFEQIRRRLHPSHRSLEE